ncbi:hypothetical protein Ahy_A05g023485 [Arachis hypogaea]|uniref:CCHC-type domain-containing protein n=1 Tax=Arachis hypogaea TaxID=3818 RepID=A0A445D3H2_ARAHY|nr:hypothetical protein Ahy_A05g023485 [Arachis hypogaea]
MKIDTNTAQKSRRKFARLCVELHLTFPLMSQYAINGEGYKIENEGLYNICFQCGIVGHEKINCLQKVLTEKSQRGEEVAAEGEESHGRQEWPHSSREEGKNGNTNMRRPSDKADRNKNLTQLIPNASIKSNIKDPLQGTLIVISTQAQQTQPLNRSSNANIKVINQAQKTQFSNRSTSAKPSSNNPTQNQVLLTISKSNMGINQAHKSDSTPVLIQKPRQKYNSNPTQLNNHPDPTFNIRDNPFINNVGPNISSNSLPKF